jgi:hypothetical protein
MNKKIISVIVDGQVPGVKQARSPVQEFLISETRRTIDLGVDTLKTQIEGTLGTFLELLNGMELDEHRFHVGGVSLTLSVNAEGKISILSAATGALGTQAGLTFTLLRKERT